MGRLEGKVAIVTGGASGLGEADAIVFAREGAMVVITDLQVELGKKLAESHKNITFMEQDVRDELRWAEVVQETVETFGRLDILVNNAGLNRFATIEQLTLDDYRFQSAVMSEGVFLGCRAAIPAMARSGGGSIINIASLAAIKGIAVIPAYSAAKGAVVSLSRSVAVHCQEQGYNIRCNTVIPGGHDTPLLRRSLADIPVGEIYSDRVRRDGVGTAEDVANLVLFLASDESRRITGASIVIDNGESIQ